MHKKEKSQVLIISLWILAILTILAISIGHRVSMALRLSRYQKDRLKAYCLAKAGINLAILELEKDKNTNDYDSPKDNWADNEEAFKNISFDENKSENKKDEFATVNYNVKDEEEPVYGVMDEERKISININTGSNNLLVALLKECEDCKFDDSQPEKLANDIRIWRGENVSGINTDTEYYENFKKAPFTNIEELLIVLEHFFPVQDYQNKAREVYKNIKDLITVYGGQVNANTASEGVLTILANSIADANEIKYVPDVIKEIRKEREDKYFEKIGDIGQGVSGDAYYVSLFNKLKTQQPQLLSVNSSYFKIEAKGYSGNITKNITAIYDRGTKKFVYWHEN